MGTPSQQPPEGLEQKLERLRDLPDFRAVVDYLHNAREEQFAHLKDCNTEKIQQRTGYLVALDDILTTLRG